MTGSETFYALGTMRLPMPWETYDSLEYDDDLRGAEYINGELVVPAGYPDWGHQTAIDYLRDQVRPTLRPGEHVTTGFAWKPPDIREEYGPDVMVFTKGADRSRFIGVPRLCIEVTASGSRGADVVLKRGKYAAAGLLHYWIVDRHERVLRCLQLDGHHYAEYSVFTYLPQHRDRVDASYADRSVELELARLFELEPP